MLAARAVHTVAALSQSGAPATAPVYTQVTVTRCQRPRLSEISGRSSSTNSSSSSSNIRHIEAAPLTLQNLEPPLRAEQGTQAHTTKVREPEGLGTRRSRNPKVWGP